MKLPTTLFGFLWKAIVASAACLAIAGCSEVPKSRDTSRMIAVPKQPKIHPQRPASSSPLGALFKSEEPKKPKNVVEWMGQERLDM